MADTADMKKTENTPKAVSRRRFIQGVIAGGAGVSSATYLFPRVGADFGRWRGRAPDHHKRQRPAAASGRDEARDAGDGRCVISWVSPAPRSDAIGRNVERAPC